MYRSWKSRWGLLWAVLLAVANVQAAQPRPFDEGRSGQAELRYINDLPVLTVAGTPEEIGRQKSVLMGEGVKKLAEYPKRFIERAGGEERWLKLLAMAKALLPQFPADHLAEISIVSRAFRRRSRLGHRRQYVGRHLSRRLWLLIADRRQRAKRHQRTVVRPQP